MTHKNKKITLLASALATASMATLMLGASNAAFATAAARVANTDPANTSDVGDWIPPGPVVDGDSLSFTSTNNSIRSVDPLTYTLNVNSVAGATLKTTKVTDIAGIVGGTGTLIINAGAKIVFGTNGIDPTKFAKSSEVGQYKNVPLTLNLSDNPLNITTDGFDAENITVVGDKTGTLTVGTTTDGTTNVVLYANQLNTMNKLIIRDKSDVTITQDLSLGGTNPYVELFGAGDTGGTINLVGSSTVITNITTEIKGNSAGHGNVNISRSPRVQSDLGSIKLNNIKIDFLSTLWFTGTTIKANKLIFTDTTSALTLPASNPNNTITADITGPGTIDSATPELNIVGDIGSSTLTSVGALNTLQLFPDVTNLNFTPTSHVNINVLDLGMSSATVSLNDNATYRFGSILNGKDATISLTKNSTLQDTIGTIKTISATNKTLTIKSVNSDTNLTWNTPITALGGLTLNAATSKTITLSGDIGTTAAKVTSPITINADSSVNYTGNIYSTGGITLDNNSVLTLNNGDYDVKISGKADGQGDVIFKGNSGVSANLGSTNKLNNIILINSSDNSGVRFSGNTIEANNLIINDKTALGLSNPTKITITATITGKGEVNTGTPTLNIIGNVGSDLTENAGLGVLRLRNDVYVTDTLNFTPVTGGYVNINSTDLSTNNVAVNLNSTAATYRFGNVSNAQNATIFLTTDSTIQDTIGAFKTISAANKTLVIKSENSDTNLTWNTPISALGSLTLDAATGNIIMLAGDIGTAAAKVTSSITLKPNAIVNYTGNIYTTGGITLGVGSNLIFNGSEYNIGSINGSADDNGSLIFANANSGETKVTTATKSTNNISQISVNSTNVTLLGEEIKFNNIQFSSSKGIAPIFTLVAGQKIDSLTSIGSVAGANIPELRLIGANQTIGSGLFVGSSNNPVNIRMMTDNIITVDNLAFSNGLVTTKNDNEAVVIMNAENGWVLGLGEQGRMLRGAAFTKNNITNLGNHYVHKTIIGDNNTAELGNTVAGTITLGHTAIGGAILKLKDQVNLIGNVVAFAGSNGKNDVTFLGNVNKIGNIGDSTNRMFRVSFSGSSAVANLSNSSIYGTAVNFGNNTSIDVSGGNATISGTSFINENIKLGSSQLTLRDQQTSDTSEWGPNTSISTDVSSNGGTVTAGHINVINNVIKVTAGSTITVTPTINDNVPLNFTTALVSVNGGTLNLNGSTFQVTGGNSFAKYAILSDSNGYNLVSSSKDSKIILQDLENAGLTNPTDISNAQLLLSATNGDAATFVANTGNITDPEAQVNAFERLTTSNAMQITSAVSQGLENGSTDAILTRVSDTALQVDRNELGRGAPAAAGDCRVVDAHMGAWLTPVYTQATQKTKGGNPGYKVKSGGAIFGLDTEANDNLIVGSAATVLSSDMKMKDQKVGDKSKINTFMFSLYGSQELVRDFFVQGIASFSTSKIKGKERRLVPTYTNANGYETAHANYGSMGFSGQVLLGYNAKPKTGVFITPVAGVRYSKVNDEAYKETGTTYQNKRVSKKSTSRVDAVVGVQLETNIQKKNSTIVPEAHAYVTRKVNGKSGKVHASLNGMSGEFIAKNDTTGKTFYNVGVGTKVMSGAMEYGIGYDAYLASKYVAHQGSLKVRVNF